uniref:Uncharacterized protein n=1 Tax=Plectus sambesii TaxID=2011161 RepID=A0A914WWH5_9BILA
MSAKDLKSMIDMVTSSTLDSLFREEHLRDDLIFCLGSATFDNARIAELRQQIVQAIKSEVAGTVDEIIAEDHILERIDQLKKHIVASEAKYGKNRRAWRPIGVPASDSYAHIRPHLVDYQQRLQQIAVQLEADVKKKSAEVELGRREVERRVSEIK